MNITSNHNQPNFGMAFHTSENVIKALQKRVKNPKQIEKLTEIINSQKCNDIVDINLRVNTDCKTLNATVFDSDFKAGKFSKFYSENIFTQLFGGGPVGFLNKLAKIADEQAEIIKGERKMQKAIQDAFKE